MEINSFKDVAELIRERADAMTHLNSEELTTVVWAFSFLGTVADKIEQLENNSELELSMKGIDFRRNYDTIVQYTLNLIDKYTTGQKGT